MVKKGTRVQFLEHKYHDEITSMVNQWLSINETDNEVIDIEFKTCGLGSTGYFCVMISYVPKKKNKR